MKAQTLYSIIIFPENRYVTLKCSKSFFNTNFATLLTEIGKYYFKMKDPTPYKVCTLLRNEINESRHLNRRRMRRARISSTQIKAMIHSFNRLKQDNGYFVRIPFAAAFILFYTLDLAKSIESQSPVVQAFFAKSLTVKIGDSLYAEPICVFSSEYYNRLSHFTNIDMKARYEALYANLLGTNTFVQDTISNLSNYTIENYTKYYK